MVNILIVEDELIIAEDLREILEGFGYCVVAVANNAEKAIQFFDKHTPDIVIMDIMLNDVMDGVQVAELIKKKREVAIIFLTSHVDKLTVERAKIVKPQAYISKPFNEKSIYAAIEIAMTNFISSQKPTVSAVPSSQVAKDSFFVRDRGMLRKVKFDDIIWLEADGNYTLLHIKDQKLALRTTLKEVEQQLPAELFIRIHKSFLINISKVTAVGGQKVQLEQVELPVGRAFMAGLMDKINVF